MAKQEYNQDFWGQFEDISQAKSSNVIPLFKMSEKGEKTRICFPLVNPKSGEVALKAVKVFNYKATDANGDEIWAKFQAPENKDGKAYKLAVRYCGEPKIERVTPVLVYYTNDEGKVVSADDYQVIPLKITPTRLEALKAIQVEFSLADHDILVTCKEKKYQNLDFNACPTCGLRKGSLKQKDAKSGATKEIEFSFTLEQIVEEAIELAKTMETSIASKWSEEQIINYFEASDDGFDDEDEEDETGDDELLEDEEETKPAPKKAQPKVKEPDEVDDEWDE